MKDNIYGHLCHAVNSRGLRSTSVLGSVDSPVLVTVCTDTFICWIGGDTLNSTEFIASDIRHFTTTSSTDMAAGDKVKDTCTCTDHVHVEAMYM